MKKGFTLAEVLITLGIIGIVAAMTLPALINKGREKEFSAKLKKSYTTLQQAYNLAVSKHGTPDNWDLIDTDSSQGAQNLLNIMAPELKVLKNCGIKGGCWYDDPVRRLNGTVWGNLNKHKSYSIVQLADGSLLAFLIRDKDCAMPRGTTPALATSCALAIVDVNGPKIPNQIGYDVFWFMLTKYNVLPFGTMGDTYQPFSTCTRSDTGLGCAAWVIYNENMEYLHCNDLSWTGKKKCK